MPARVTATVAEIPGHILEGERVHRGELLAQLDDSDFVRQVEIAEQNIADLNAQLERLEAERESWTERLRLAEEAVELVVADFQRIESAFREGVAKQREVDQARQALINATRDQVAAREEVRKLGPRETSLRDALINAGKARLRPIVLTTITTILGLTPLMLEQSFQARFLIPMAIAISFGLMSATVLILLLLPCLLVILDDIKRAAHWLWLGRGPTDDASQAESVADVLPE